MHEDKREGIKHGEIRKQFTSDTCEIVGRTLATASVPRDSPSSLSIGPHHLCRPTSPCPPPRRQYCQPQPPSCLTKRQL